MGSRRKIMTSVAAAATIGSPLAAFADGASSPSTRARAFSIYGSRIYRVKDAGLADILDEKGSFDIFVTGATRKGSDDQKALKKIKKTIFEAAEKGDAAGAKAGVKEFITVAKI